MSYEEAFEALRNGDFHTAAPLLEKAAHETGYASDIINHSYTIALYRSGDRSRLADVAFRIANSLLARDQASAMDYFQRALFAGLDPAGVRHIAGVFEGWRTDPPPTQTSEPDITRVGHVVGCLLSGHGPTQYVKMLASSLRLQGIQSTVFTTESAASWFFNPTGVPQSQAVDLEGKVEIASVEGDFLERAERVAQQIRNSGIRIVFFHGSLIEQITARVAAMKPAPVQINVHDGSDMDADLFNGHIHLFRNALERTRFSRPAEWIPLASDIERRLQMSEPVTRQAMGLESANTISATFGNLQKVGGGGYLRVLCEILNRFPKHFHIFAGAGDVKSIRSHLHSEGVLPRVRFLGHVSDVAGLLTIIDVYLASFPHSGGRSILEAMGAAKPVVVLRFPPDSPCNSGSELVGVPELTAPGEANYIDIADRLLRTPAFREEQGQAMYRRFRAEFRPERLGERYKGFMERFTIG